MKKSMKFIFGIIGILGIFSFLIMLLGFTANFQKQIDLVGTVSLFLIGVPLIVLSILALYFCFSGKAPFNFVIQIIMIALSIIVLSFAWYTINGISKEGWLEEAVTADAIKTTSDDKYQYCLEFINLYQKNQYSRLFIKNIDSGDEKRIEINLPINDINGLITSQTDWVYLEPIDTIHIYQLATTDELPFPIEHFEINIENEQVKRIKD